MFKKLSYQKTGVSYKLMDPLKRLAQIEGKKTSRNLLSFGISEIEKSRGESAYVVEHQDSYLAFVQEGLGTKNLVADQMHRLNGKTYYDYLAQDTVAMIVNDLITVGAKPSVILAYWAAGSQNWFKDKKRSHDLVKGWAKACNIAGAVWGGGETPTLTGVIEKSAIDLAGAGFGLIQPKTQLILGDKLEAGDRIVFIESSGIHANGLTLARKIADKLPQGYTTLIDKRITYGEALLIPSIIYAKVINSLLEQKTEIHYMVNITGHGWRKLMRFNKPFTYRITKIPPVPKILQFIQKNGPVDDVEAYGNFNMGAGFAIFVPGKDAQKVIAISRKHKLKAYLAGRVEKGKKQVIIEPKDIIFGEKSLQLRL